MSKSNWDSVHAGFKEMWENDKKLGVKSWAYEFAKARNNKIDQKTIKELKQITRNNLNKGELNEKT